MNVPQKVLSLVPESVESDWHQHSNGGGWVYKAAEVEDSAYIGPDARIYGNAWIYGDARVYGDAWEQSVPYIQGSRHALTLCSLTQIAIGCHVHDIAEWQEKYKEIGRDNHYTEEQIEEYGEHIAHLARIAERLRSKKVS